MLDDAQVTSVLEKMIKQRKESIVAFEKGARADLVAKETAEIVVLQPYLPAQLSDAELDALIAEAIATTGAASIKDMGKVMGVVKAEGGRQGRHGRRRRPHQSQARRLSRMGGRGLATAGALILIALVCISISRKIEAERRQLGRFPRERLPLVIGGSIAALLLCALVVVAILR